MSYYDFTGKIIYCNCDDHRYSKFTEFVKILMNNNKKFIILGNINAFSYKDMFSWLTQNKIWLGNRPLNKGMYFNVPDDVKEYFLKEKKEGSTYVIKNNQVLGKLASVCWYTNITRPKTKKLKLECKYSPDKYQKYDNYDVINVDRVKDIPYDYDGIMGVPITYLGVHNPSEYEILGIMNWCLWRGYECYAIVNGKHKYQRLIIKKRPAP